MIIAVDFDGTLHRSEFPKIGKPEPYAAECLRKLKADGHFLIIWTCRTGNYLTDAVNWLMENDIPFHRINDQCPEVGKLYSDLPRKIYAHIYIDDKQIGGLPCWDQIYEEVRLADINRRVRSENR